jgi:HlyD family secretion protein
MKRALAMSRKRLLVIGAAVAVLGLVAFWLLPQPLEVDASEVAAGRMQVTVDDQGETRSHDRFLLTAPVAGRLMRIELHDGDEVVENQLLAQIAPLPLSAREHDEISARVASAEALQREAEQRVRHADEDLGQARRELDRQQKLVKDGFIAPQAAEQANNMVITALIEADAARSRARAAAADVKVARSGLVTARTDGPGAGRLVQVRAPVAGRILRIHDPSERVVAAGSPLLTLGALERLEVVVELLSSDAVKIRAGMPVLVEGWGGNKTLRAKVRLVEPFAATKVSALGIEEKRTNVIADFVDPPGMLGDGFRITARIVTWQVDKTLKAPSSALFSCEDGWCVFAIEDGRARRRSIEVGHRNPLEAEVLKGLDAGQLVIRHPGNQVQEGMRVRVRP